MKIFYFSDNENVYFKFISENKKDCPFEQPF